MRIYKGYSYITVFVLIIAVLGIIAVRGGEIMSHIEKAKDDKVPAQQCGLISDEELRRTLTPEQYRVTKQSGTEAPFMNKYWDNKKEGLYVDIISGEPLFSSKEKFDSGTGWPSFTAPIDKEHIVEKTDTSHGMKRVEVRSKMSDAHLGHIFDDGPAPTGQRYCMNSAALRFIPKENLEKEGYGQYAGLFEKAKGEEKLETAAFAAGCFWGVEAAFQEIKGVLKTTAGYMGGRLMNPTYAEVCSNNTGHAETVQVEYDPAKVSYERLLEVFFSIHDPTAFNRQGPDVGSQYRSAIFYYTPEQESAARRMKEKLEESGKVKGKIVTEIVPAKELYRAEEYHQKYYRKRGVKSTCHIPAN